MKVSLITVTYNSEKTLRDTLESVESQSYENIEYIIIDGASTDKTLELVNNVSSRITKIISEKDQGIYDALNKGIQLATGDVIGFIHSDDVFSRSDTIERIVKEFQEKNADVVYGDLVFFDKDKTDKIKRYWRSGKFKKIKLALGWAPPHPSFYMKRHLYLDCGLFDLSFRIASDYDQMVRVLKRNDINISYIPLVLVNMRLGGESTKLENVISSTREIIHVMKKHKIIWQIAIISRKISKILQKIR